MKRQNAFTLIELLVVIAIIAILAAILFPVFAKAREKARQTTCASNLKQLTLGVLQYVQDYDEFAPCGIQTPAHVVSYGIAPGIGWAGQIYSYVKSTGIYTCPDDTGYAPAIANGVLMSYSYNQNLTMGLANNGTASNDAKLSSPPLTVLFCETTTNYLQYNAQCGKYPATDVVDGEAVQNAAGYSFVSSVTNGRAGYEDTGAENAMYLDTGPLGETGVVNGNCPNEPYFPLGRHPNGSNFAFWDGHVKWLVGTHVSPGNNAAAQTSAPTASNAGGTSGTNADGTTYVATYSVM